MIGFLVTLGMKGLLKTTKGLAMIEHIGEYTRGKRIMKGEPGWVDGMENYWDNDYCSKSNSKLYKKDLSE